jgi:hypothetical protein
MSETTPVGQVVGKAELDVTAQPARGAVTPTAEERRWAEADARKAYPMPDRLVRSQAQGGRGSRGTQG